MIDDIYCDSGHLCVVCWARERHDAIRRWLFLRLPIHWRHRIIMRAAMKRRRVWRELQEGGNFLAFLADPRMEHAQRRLMNSLMGSLTSSFPTYKNVEWVEVGDPE